LIQPVFSQLALFFTLSWLIEAMRVTEMNSMKTSSKLAVAAAVLCASMQAAAGNIKYDYATVIEAKPIIKTVRVSIPREECWDEEVVYQEYGGDHGVATVVGGILGGAFGNAVGHHKRNKQVGAAVGAVLGATLGHAASVSAGSQGSYYRTEERCRIEQIFQEEDRVVGYRVRYRYGDQTYTTRTDMDPGDSLKVRVSVSPVY
jgi:uncharacterized protein YcfJ